MHTAVTKLNMYMHAADQAVKQHGGQPNLEAGKKYTQQALGELRSYINDSPGSDGYELRAVFEALLLMAKDSVGEDLGEHVFVYALTAHTFDEVMSMEGR